MLPWNKCGKYRVRICLPRRRSTLVARWVECWMFDSDIRSDVGSNPSGGSMTNGARRSLRWLWTYCTALFLPGIIEWMDTQDRVKSGPHEWLWDSCKWLELAAKGAKSWLTGSCLCASPRWTRATQKLQRGRSVVRLCLPHHLSTLVARWVECWMADSDIRSSVGSNRSGGSHTRERMVALKIITCCSITQTPTEQ